jgi:hypothetical protein
MRPVLVKILAGLAALLFAGALIRSSQPKPNGSATASRVQVSPGPLPSEASQAADLAPRLVRGTNRRTAFASTSVLVFALILLLGTLGVVNGLWSKNLTVNGQIETGDLVASWDKLHTKDVCGDTDTAFPPTPTPTPKPSKTPHTYGIDDSGGGAGDDHDDYGEGDHDEDHPCEPTSCSEYEKSQDNCAPECDAAIGGIGVDSTYGNQVAYVDIENAAPEYWCDVKGWVSNLGSIPFNIVGVNGVLDAKNEDGLSFYDLNPHKPGICKLVDKDGKTTTNAQVDPGKDGIVVCRVVIDKEIKICKRWYHNECKEWTYEDAAKAGWTYHFAIEVCVAQWNENPSTGGAKEDFAACKHPDPGTHEGPDSTTLPTPNQGH